MNRIVAFAVNRWHCQGPSGEPQIIGVAYNEPGFHPIYTQAGDPAALVASHNKALGITQEIADAFVSGSMFGWKVPAAKAARDWYFEKHQKAGAK